MERKRNVCCDDKFSLEPCESLPRALWLAVSKDPITYVRCVGNAWRHEEDSDKTAWDVRKHVSAGEA